MALNLYGQDGNLNVWHMAQPDKNTELEKLTVVNKRVHYNRQRPNTIVLCYLLRLPVYQNHDTWVIIH